MITDKEYFEILDAYLVHYENPGSRGPEYKETKERWIRAIDEREPFAPIFPV